MGRPTKRDTNKSEKLNIRLTKEDKQLIQDCADRMNISKSDVIVKAIELLNKTVMWLHSGFLMQILQKGGEFVWHKGNIKNG